LLEFVESEPRRSAVDGDALSAGASLWAVD
jgi:hypothetical protein